MKESVRRNIRRFPPDFMFELTVEELKNLTSQFATSSWGEQRHKPFAFTLTACKRNLWVCAYTQNIRSWKKPHFHNSLVKIAFFSSSNCSTNAYTNRTVFSLSINSSLLRIWIWNRSWTPKYLIFNYLFFIKIEICSSFGLYNSYIYTQLTLVFSQTVVSGQFAIELIK